MQLCGPPHLRLTKSAFPRLNLYGNLALTERAPSRSSRWALRRSPDPIGFEVVPGKDPNGWSFILEPYLWGLGVDGTVGVKRFDTHVDYNPLTVVKHLDWGIMAKGEVRKGKWGILGDGFFAQLSASGDSPGPLYNNANIKLQQGMVELALAYRIIDDRRGFLDIYAGARYNYFGIDVDASIDDAGVQEVSDDAARRIFGAVGARVQGAVNAEVQKLRN